MTAPKDEVSVEKCIEELENYLDIDEEMAEAAIAHLRSLQQMEAEIAAKDKILDQHIAALRSVAWAITDKACGGFDDIVAEAKRVRAEAEKYRSAREKVAEFMLEHGFATGHGDTIDDLLLELGGQLAECRRDAERYRWLRDNEYLSVEWLYRAEHINNDLDEDSLTYIDIAIDEALAAAKETPDDPRD